jgi:hypothetical protein
MTKKSENFKHSLVGPKGVSGKLFVEMEEYLETSNFIELHNEAIMGLSLIEKFDHPYIMGEIPPELRKNYGNMFLESEILDNLDQYDPDGFHYEKMKSLSVQQRRRYCYFAFGALSPWFGVCYLRYNNFLKKTSESALENEWHENAKYFPKLKEYVNSLKSSLFSEVGRVLFFVSYPTVPTVVHRDFIQEPHRDHSVNLFFNKGRPAFIYNELTQAKHYLDPACRAYFFNNRDYHGVDAENEMRYTLRIDGTFTQAVQDKLKLEGGWLK